MKTLLQINLTCEKGSTGRIAVAIHNFAVLNGFNSYIAYGLLNSNIKNSFKIESKFQNIARRLKNKIFGVKSKHSRPGTKSLINKIKKIEPDIIHMHNIHHQILDYEYFLKYLSTINIKIILTLHDCWAFTGGCYHYTAVKCFQWQSKCISCPSKTTLDNTINEVSKDFLIKKELFANLKNFRVTAVSNWLKGEADKSYLAKHPIKTIYDGIDTEIFKPCDFSDYKLKCVIKDEFVILGVASVWNEGKRFDDFLKLADVLDDNFIIIIVGQLNELQCSKIPDNMIHLPDVKSNIDLCKIYSMADVLINFSLEETFGMVVGEALACGTPVIVYNSTANPEIVGENCGYVIEKDNFEGVLENINTIKQNGKAFYSDYCIKHIGNNFTTEIMVKKYLDLYSSCLEGDTYD